MDDNELVCVNYADHYAADPTYRLFAYAVFISSWFRKLAQSYGLDATTASRAELVTLFKRQVIPHPSVSELREIEALLVNARFHGCEFDSNGLPLMTTKSEMPDKAFWDLQDLDTAVFRLFKLDSNAEVSEIKAHAEERAANYEKRNYRTYARSECYDEATRVFEG